MLSGILETASIMVLLLYASLPTLSRVSRILREGNMENTLALQPGSLTTGLFSRSSCRRDLNLLRGLRSQIFSILLAPIIIVCRCLDRCTYCRCYPGIWLKTISRRIRAGKLGKFSSETMAQSLRVSICKYWYLSSSARTSAVKQPPKRTETMSMTQTRWGGVPSVWSRMAATSLFASGLDAGTGPLSPPGAAPKRGAPPNITLFDY